MTCQTRPMSPPLELRQPRPPSALVGPAVAYTPLDDPGLGRDDARFREQVAKALRAVASLDRPGELPAYVIEGETDDAEIKRLLEAAQARVRKEIRSRPPAREDLYRLYLTVSDLRDDVAARLSCRPIAALVAVRVALARLRGAQSLAALMSRATEELCGTCEFDRAMIWRVDGAEAIAESVCMPRDPQFAREVLEYARAHPPKLRHLMIETEMLRRGAAALILDAAENPRVHMPFVDLVKTKAYVAAPIMPQGRVIGFLHADLADSERRPDELDREVLRTFAEAFGYAIERTILLERLQAQRDQVAQLMKSAHEVTSMLSSVDVELVAAEELIGPPTKLPAAEPTFLPTTDFGRILTRREVDVMQIVATGASNARIADQLVISEGTVKCHVRSILRKLHCANRSEAISRYLALVEGQAGSPG
jgi:LuxR family transcriptional regulator, regulator of acetate metabolism